MIVIRIIQVVGFIVMFYFAAQMAGADLHNSVARDKATITPPP